MIEETQERPIAASYKDFKMSAQQPVVEKSPEPAADPKPQQEASDPDPEKVEDKKAEATDTAAPKDSSAPPAKEGKTVEATDTSDKDTQEEKERKEKQRRDRSAEGKIKELTAAQTREKERADAQQARADKLERELEDSRKASAAKPTEIKLEAKPAPAAVPPPADKDPRPSLKAITQKAADGVEPYAGKEYEELQDMWAGEVDDWREREATRKELARKAAAESEEATKRATTDAERAEARNRNYQSSMQVAKAKYSDFDQVVEANIRTNTMSNDGIKAGLGAAMNPGELVYELSKDGGAEYVRIAKLPPDEAFTETVWLDRHLAKQAGKPVEPAKPEPVAAAPKPATDPPPAPKPAVSKVPAPYVPANGVEDPAPKRPTSYHGAGGFKRTYQPDGRPRA